MSTPCSTAASKLSIVFPWTISSAPLCPIRHRARFSAGPAAGPVLHLAMGAPYRPPAAFRRSVVSLRRALLPRLLTALACAAILGALAACRESDQEQAREVVQDYVDARTSGDFGAICDLYSAIQAELGVVDDCEGFVREQSGGGADGGPPRSWRSSTSRPRLRPGTPTSTSSAVEGPARIGLILSPEGDDWKISGLQ